MRYSLTRFVLFALISSAVTLIDTATTSRAEVAPTPPGIALRVFGQPIAHLVTDGVPVMTPLTRRGKGGNDAGSKLSPPAAAGPRQGLALPSAGAQSAGCATAGTQPAPLVALASALKCDPDLIYEYVYNNIEFEPLYGSNKGPLGTLLDRRGDDADQAILFVTLLNIAGYSQTGYAGVLLLVGGDEIANLLGVRNDAVAIENLLNLGGIPFEDASTNPDGSLGSIVIAHFWAALQLNGTWYYFDPSFKQHTILTGISGLAGALGYNRTQFLSDAGGTIDSVSISNINRTNLRADLVSYTNNLINSINQNNRTWSVGNVIGGKAIQPLQGSPIRVTESSLTPSSTFPATCPFQSTPPECRTFVTITMPGASPSQAIKLYTDQIYGHRITVFSTPSGSNFVPQLMIDGAPPSCVAAGTCTNVGPPTAGGATWSIPTQVVEPNQPQGTTCGSGITACQTLTVAAGSSYLVGIGTGRVGRGMADYHRQLLSQARAAGNADTSELVLGESLAAISYGWLAQISAAQNTIDHLTQVTTLYNFALGITGQSKIQQTGFQGPYVDLPVNYAKIAVQNSTGPTTIVGGISYPTAFISAATALSQALSSFESAVLEQTQAPVAGMTAASTIKIIDSNMNPGYSGSLGKTFFADGTTSAGQSAYTSNILPLISPHYNSSDLSSISNAVANGHQVLIPENGQLFVGHWSGAGYTDTWPQTGQVTVTQKISGGMSGGFSGENVEDPPENTEETLPNTASSDTASSILNTIPAPSNPQVVEPIDGVTGAYIYKNTDLTTGSGKFPYSLNFSRTYLSSSGSSRTTTNSDNGIGNGWSHNWINNVQIQSDPYLGIGIDNSSAVSAATSIVALYIMQDLMSVTPTAQTATVSSMITRWFTDQLTGNTAIVSQPDTTEEFIALPHADGASNITYNPPPGSSARLSQIASSQFTYMQKDGTTSNFGPSPIGALQSIVYPNGVTINLSYSGSPLSLHQITNNLGRSLTLNYSGTHISSVTDDSGRSVAYSYDGNSNLTSFTDPIGASTSYAYDISGNFDTFAHLTQVFYPNNPSNAFVTNWYDALGRVVKQASATGAITNLYFAGSRTEIVDPLLNRHVTYQTDRGRVLSDAYVLSSSFGNVFNDTAQQNGLINVTQNQYDGLDRLTATVLPGTGSVAYSYAVSPNPWANNISTVTQNRKPASSTTPPTLTTTYTYDQAYNKPASITDPLGLVTTFVYNQATGNLVSTVSDAGGTGHFNATSSFSYNIVGQVLTSIDPLQTRTQYSYDAFGNQTSVTRDCCGTGHLNQTTTLAYNAFGDAVSSTDPNGNITTSIYDADRRRISTTSPKTAAAPGGLVTAFTYDPVGQLLQTSQSAGGPVLRKTSTTYTPTGKISTTTDANGNPTRYAYDADDRLTSTTDPLGRQTTFAYDAMSRQISLSNPAVQSSPLLQQAYTPDGLIASLTDANSNVTSLAYDGFNRLSTTTYPLGSTKTLTYDADNNVLTRKTRANQTVTYKYDTLNRLITKTPPSPAPVVSYSYDLASRRISASDTSAAITAAVSPSGVPVQYATSIAYDAINNPTSVSWNPAATFTAPTASSVTFGHTYNLANQRIAQTATDNSWLNYPAATPSTVSYTSNALNQYTAVGTVSPTYDNNGNLTSDGTFIYGYDAKSRLASAVGAGNTAAYTFDAQSRRKTKTVNGATTVFVTDPDNREVLEYDGTSGVILRWYAYGLGSNNVLNQTNVAASTRSALIPDIQGSIIATLDSATGSLTKASYSPYGGSTNAPGSFGYTAQRIDPETNGLYYYRTRHYSPLLGRFLQTDTSGTKGGINLYAYAKNDPLNLVDITGRAPDAPNSYAAPASLAASNVGEELEAAEEVAGAPGVIVIGEDMAGRVIPTAEARGAGVYSPPPAPPEQWMQNNRNWINQIMDEGCTILDCGAAPGRANYPNPTSPYYEMELDQIMGRGYPNYGKIPAVGE